MHSTEPGLPSIELALAGASGALAGVSETPRLDAEVLLCHVLQKPRVFLYTWPERVLTDEEHAQFQALVARRAAGEPVAHLTGIREFWSLSLQVTPETLIPRPETELLVEEALRRIPADAPCAVADLGTGSGAIALAIASERPKCSVLAVDRSAEALAVAESNARTLALANVEFVQGDWCTPLEGMHFQVIVSNPPYIAIGDVHLQQGDVRFEPPSALVSGEKGLDAIRHIISCAKSHLEQGGWLLLEHGYDQGPAVRRLLRQAGYRAVTGCRDALGHQRVAVGRWG